jgi:hypothetical protein
MLPTVEARWFMAGRPAEEVQRWFERRGPVTNAQPRTDSYLCLPGMTSIGVKLREGKLEVKRRDIDFGLAPLGSRATGRLGLWRKWSFTVAGTDRTEAPDDDWISIEKKRRLRKYAISGITGLTAVDPDSFPERGCSVELTEMNVRDVEWWSVGFEAFGPDEAHLRGTLELVATTCLDSQDHPALHAENSFDYPEWLAGLAHISGGKLW